MANLKKKLRALQVKAKRVKRSDIIIPSIDIKYVGVHKIQDKMSCERLYFWRWVLNLIPKMMNMNFWYGGVMHKGCEMIPQGYSLSEILKAMRKESNKLLKGQILAPQKSSEVDLQLEMILIIFEVFFELHSKTLRKIKIKDTEIVFRRTLERSPLTFIGTVDAYGILKKIITLVEYKTSSQITAEYFKRLRFDKQVNGYALGLESILGNRPGELLYFVLRKPSIKVRMNETAPKYLKRLREDLHDRSDWYFIPYRHRFGRQSVNAVLSDIECASFDLCSKFDYLSKDELLSPYNWGRNDRACFNFGTCPYFILCMNCYKYKMFLKLYKMRDIRYNEEKQELSKKLIIKTK